MYIGTNENGWISEKKIACMCEYIRETEKLKTVYCQYFY